jgi:pullulanase/glycogen debranching enzyme
VAINRRNVDTGKWAPKSYVINDSTSFGTKPARAQKDAIIYEAHVRGLTQHASSTSLATIMSGIATVDSVPAHTEEHTKVQGTWQNILKQWDIIQ